MTTLALFEVLLRLAFCKNISFDRAPTKALVCKGRTRLVIVRVIVRVKGEACHDDPPRHRETGQESLSTQLVKKASHLQQDLV